MLATIPVQYSCVVCGLLDATTDVPERARPDDDVAAWMLQTIAYVAANHHARSPRCRAVTVDLKVPVDGRGWLGGPLLH